MSAALTAEKEASLAQQDAARAVAEGELAELRAKLGAAQVMLVIACAPLDWHGPQCARSTALKS